MRKILLKIQYDGTAFHGWQRQPNLLTCQGEIERVISILCNRDIKVLGTSRTDRGVHALGQIASFSGEFSIPTENIKRAGNRLLHPAIQILEVQDVCLDFHPMLWTESKTYRYEIVNTKYKNPLYRNFVYYVDKSLDVSKMRAAISHIVGKRDFKSFQAAGGEVVESTVRTINFIEIDQEGDKISIEINGDGFLYKMVRNIVGTLVDVGCGKFQPEDVANIIEACDRKMAGHTAEPQGLYLKEIFHKKNIGG